MGRKALTTQQYISIVEPLHNHKYDYSKTVYTKATEKVIITCPTHGDFEVSAHHHRNKSRPVGCPICSKQNQIYGKTKSLETVLLGFKERHGDTYDYSKINYIDGNTPVEIWCKEHGESFWQKPRVHQIGHGCPKCANAKKSRRFVRTTEQFIEKANKIHQNKFDYSITEYQGYTKPVDIICPIHGKFTTLARNHLRGCDCSKCGDDTKRKNLTKELETFIKDSKKVHGEDYEYTKSIYKSCDSPIILVCKKHGDFVTTPTKNLSGRKCPKCTASQIRSSFEDEILEYINTIYEGHVISNSRSVLNNGKEIDIYFPDKNLAIECNGIYYHSYRHKDSGYHVDKSDAAEDVGIDLIHIWQQDWEFNKNFYKQLIKSKLNYEYDYSYIKFSKMHYSNFKHYWNKYVPFSMQVPHFNEEFVLIHKSSNHVGYFSYLVDNKTAYIKNVFYPNMRQFGIDIATYFIRNDSNVNNIIISSNRDLGSIETEDYVKKPTIHNIYEYYHPHLGYMGSDCESQIGIDWLQEDIQVSTRKTYLSDYDIEKIVDHYNIYKYYRSGRIDYELIL